MVYTPDILRKVVEISTQKNGKLLYRPYLVMRKNLLGFIPVSGTFYVLELSNENSYFHYLKKYDGFTYFRTYDSEEKALDALDKAIKRHTTEVQDKIDKTITKVIDKIIDYAHDNQ